MTANIIRWRRHLTWYSQPSPLYIHMHPSCSPQLKIRLYSTSMAHMQLSNPAKTFGKFKLWTTCLDSYREWFLKATNDHLTPRIPLFAHPFCLPHLTRTDTHQCVSMSDAHQSNYLTRLHACPLPNPLHWLWTLPTDGAPPPSKAYQVETL